MFDKQASIYVAGQQGLVGSALVRKLREQGFNNLLLPTRAELDLRNQAAVDAWFERFEPSYVFLAAGTVAGIWANATRPAEFIYDNLMIHATVVHAAYRQGTTKLLYLGSSCIYPREAEQPMREEALLTGPLEPTNEPYAIAKIAGMKLCQAYRRQYGCNFVSVMPTNLYGPGDNFDLKSSHVIAALIRRFHEARLAGDTHVTVWGTGTAKREFMYVDDLADACVFLMEEYSDEGHINIGTGQEVEIRELAILIRDIVFPEAEIRFNPDKPDGAPRKLLDTSRLHSLGWQAKTDLETGLQKTYSWFLEEFP
jgi:GDP-L-fucose synthase